MSDSNGANGSNGAGRTDEKVRVAIVGTGNCANSFIQGVQYYKDADPSEEVPGLMHVDLGGYHVGDVEFVAAFDIDSEKVGKDLSEAIWSGQNDTIKFAEVPNLGVKVERGMTLDGLGKYLKEKITKAPGETADVVGILKETKADVLVCYLPVGSEDATKWYVEQALKAGVGFVNCLPVFIAREDYWDKRFKEAGLPIIGDDIKSQVGATIVHRQLARLFHDRGVRVERTSQLNVGGNMDFYNMLERERLDSKKISKTNAVTSIMGHDLPAESVHVGPSDYVPWLTDRKWAHIRLEGKAFGDVPLNVELKLEVWDSPNSAGVVIDAVRLIKLALNNGIAGQLDGPSSYLMKSPHSQRPDDEAREQTEEFIAANARGKGARPRWRSRQQRSRRKGLGSSRPSPGVSMPPGSYAAALCRPSALDSPGHAPPAWHREPGQRLRRAGLGGAGAARPQVRVAGVGDQVKKLLRASTGGHRPRPRARSRRGSPRPRCATPPRSTSPPSTRRRSGCSRPRWRGRWSRSSSAASTPARWPRRADGRAAGALLPRPPTSWSSPAGGDREWSQVADELEAIYTRLVARRHDPSGNEEVRRRIAERPLIEVDLHMHTDHSPDCATPVEVLLETARDRGLGAIAITDHNEVSGALEARRIAEEMDDIKVIVAEEVKTAEQGEVIGLFLEEKIPKGMTMAETIAAIRAPGRPGLRAAPLRPLPLGARLRAPARHRRGDRRARGLQPARRADRLQRGGRALRPQVPDRAGRRLRQPRRPGAGQRAGADPRLRRARGVPRGDARRRHHPQAQEPRLRADAEAAADGGPAEGAETQRSRRQAGARRPPAQERRPASKS